MTLSQPHVLAALEAFPMLQQQAGASLRLQASRIAERNASFRGRHKTLGILNDALRSVDGGLISVQGVSGSGVTTLLCHLAATRPCAFWLKENDGGQGVIAFAAQLLALYGSSVPLVPPAVSSDARVLERMLSETSRRSGDQPLLLIVDAPETFEQPLYPDTPPFPSLLPPGVLLVYGSVPGARLPLAPALRLMLPVGEEALTDVWAALEGSSPEPLREELAAKSQGNFLYLRLATGLLENGRLTPGSLPLGLDGLHSAWWDQLDAVGRRLALLLAAAGEPLPEVLCSELLGSDLQSLLVEWAPLLERTAATRIEHGEPASAVALYHRATAAFIARREPAALAHIHGEVAAYSRRSGIGDWGATSREVLPGMEAVRPDGYLLRQFARHGALSDEPASLLPLVAERPWVRFHKRQGTMGQAAQDAAWYLRGVAATGSLLQMASGALLTGTLATLSRSLPTEAPAELLINALGTPEREAVLKRLLELCDQLPDGRDKALLLRRLGEVCYGERRMRSTAMRLLSQALDLEEQGQPRVWRDEREQLQASLSRAALAHGDSEAALTISGRISHAERRGMVQTEVVRALLARGEHSRAGDIAREISHESMRPWAQAEVAVALARDGELDEAETLLATIALETANSWAQIALACDAAAIDDGAARSRIERLASDSQRDRGRAHLAHALAKADKDGDALDVAEQIGNVAVRVAALLDLRLTLEGLVAMLALEQATAAISGLTDDDRVPLVAALAEAHAAIGRRERAISIATQLAEGEERDRALARVAVALASAGEYAQAQQTVAGLADDDERDWALDELTRILARANLWQDAQLLGQQIVADEQRAHTLTELAIEQARSGDPLQAHTMACAIELSAERARALTAIAPILVAAGQSGVALASEDLFEQPDALSRYQAAIVVALAERATGSGRHNAQNTVATDSVPIASQSRGSSADWLRARELASIIARPADQARALLALALAIAHDEPELGPPTLGSALHTVVSSRGEVLRCLELATPVMATLGGASLLVALAAAADEIDSW